MPAAHPEFPRFFAALADPALFAPWEGDVVRQALPRWMSRPYRLTGAGSLRTGGRWTARGLMPSVYASTDPATLAAEANHKWTRFGWTAAQFHPQTTVSMHWKLRRVVDLTQPGTLAALHVTSPQIAACDWEAKQAEGDEPLTQAIARAAFERLAEGLVVPSVRLAGGVNVVYFPVHRLDGSEILTPDEASIPFVHGC